MRSLGLRQDSRVVCLDRNEAYGGMLAAARVWWLLRLYGHSAVSVLHGGLPRWRALGYPLTDSPPTTSKVDATLGCFPHRTHASSQPGDFTAALSLEPSYVDYDSLSSQP